MKKTKTILTFLSAALLAASGSAFAATTFLCETSEPRANMFIQGEDIYLYFTATGLKSREKGVSADLVVKDAFDKVVHEKKGLHIEVNDVGTGTSHYLVSHVIKPLGFYRVFATLSDGTKLPAIGSRPEGYVTFAILRDPKRKGVYTMPYSHFMTEGGGWRGFMGGGCWSQHQGSGQWRHLEYEGLGTYAKNPNADKVILRESLKKAGPVKPGEIRNDYGIANMMTGPSPKWPRTTEYFTATSIKTRIPMLAPKGLEAWRDFCDTLSKNWAKQFADHPIRLYQFTSEWDPVYGVSTWEDFRNFFRVAYETIHRNDPKACILLMPGDLEGALRNGMAEFSDAISEHSYVGFPVEANGLVERCRRKVRMVRELAGKDMPFYGTEFGFSTHGLPEREGIQMYGMVRGALIMLGEGWRSNSLFKGADYRNEMGYGFSYNLDYDAHHSDMSPTRTSPKPVMPALDAMINYVEGHNSVGPVEFLGDTVLGYVLKAEDGHTVIPLWDYGDGSRVTVEVGREQVEVADMMGNLRTVKAPGGKLTLDLTEAPQYVLDVNPDTWTRERLAAENEKARIQREKRNFRPVTCEALLPTLKKGVYGMTARLMAQGGRPASGTAKVRLPGHPDGRAQFAFSLKADETKDFTVTFGALDVSAFEEVPVEVEITVGGRTYVVKDEMNYLFAARMETPTFDGKDDEWTGVRAWAIDATKSSDLGQFHEGAKDMRGDVRVGWNDEYLLFFVRTEDDVFLQQETGYKTWDWDCVQMGFTKVYRHRNTNNMWLDSLTRCRTELDFALTKNGPEMFRTMTWDPKAYPKTFIDPDKGKLGITQRKDADGCTCTNYEIGIRWEVLGLAKVSLGERLGWAVALLDQDTLDRTVQIGPSKTGAFALKDPMKFGMLTLGEAE